MHALLQAGASVSAPDATHWTPLLLAAFKGHNQAMSTPLGHGVDCYRADHNGWMALYWAKMAHHEKCADLLFHHVNQNPQHQNPSSMSSTKNISLKALTVSQAKSTMTSLHKETSSLSHAAKVEDLSAFSSLLDGAKAFYLDEIHAAYDANLTGACI